MMCSYQTLWQQWHGPSSCIWFSKPGSMMILFRVVCARRRVLTGSCVLATGDGEQDEGGDRFSPANIARSIVAYAKDAGTSGFWLDWVDACLFAQNHGKVLGFIQHKSDGASLKIEHATSHLQEIPGVPLEDDFLRSGAVPRTKDAWVLLSCNAWYDPQGSANHWVPCVMKEVVAPSTYKELVQQQIAKLKVEIVMFQSDLEDIELDDDPEVQAQIASSLNEEILQWLARFWTVWNQIVSISFDLFWIVSIVSCLDVDFLEAIVHVPQHVLDFLTCRPPEAFPIDRSDRAAGSRALCRTGTGASRRKLHGLVTEGPLPWKFSGQWLQKTIKCQVRSSCQTDRQRDVGGEKGWSDVAAYLCFLLSRSHADKAGQTWSQRQGDTGTECSPIANCSSWACWSQVEGSF